MVSVLRYVPGVVAASVAFVATKIVAWTEIGFEFGVFLAAYLVVVVLVDRGMKRYGTGNA
jgi:hypothetical protein